MIVDQSSGLTVQDVTNSGVLKDFSRISVRFLVAGDQKDVALYHVINTVFSYVNIGNSNTDLVQINAYCR